MIFTGSIFHQIVQFPTIIGQSGSFILQVLLETYQNPTSEDCDGCNCELLNSFCDSLFGRSPCDNRFTFCLQRADALTSSQCTYGTITSANDLEDDSFSFSNSITSQLGLINPLSFTPIPSGVSLKWTAACMTLSCNTCHYEWCIIL